MSDPYRISPENRPSSPRPRPRPRRTLRAALLWIVLAAGVAVNLTANLTTRADFSPVGLAGGVVALLAGVGLFAHWAAGRHG
ncbi:hypothetical protein [Bailinhaonella thermotolerans]|uniref:hypothetical protein n=1 Tax=Bailinhaonella thermotolerans TaxID=1070861 RepID=UPI0011C45A60|nr:hypothetical protein [Bailinhaonella thermotolerans]